MSQAGDFGQLEPLGGGGDDLGDLKVKRGGGVVIAILFIVGLVALAGGGVWYFAFREDPAEAHRVFRRQVLGPVHGQYYKTFWNCALAAPLANYKNNAELQAKILENGEGVDASRYGHHLLEDSDCLPLLAKGVTEYQGLKTNPLTPPGYEQLLDDLAAKVVAVQKAWQAHAEFLVKADERRELKERIKTRGEHWVGYQSSVNHRVPEKIAFYTPNAVTYTRFIQCVLGDRDFASFTGGEGQSAQEQLVSLLDQQCAQNRAAFLDKIQHQCRSKLFPTEVPEPDDTFKRVAKHWAKVDNDFGSAVPMIDCLDEYETDQTKTLVEGIAKAWYGYGKAYRAVVDYSKQQSGGGGR